MGHGNGEETAGLLTKPHSAHQRPFIKHEFVGYRKPRTEPCSCGAVVCVLLRAMATMGVMAAASFMVQTGMNNRDTSLCATELSMWLIVTGIAVASWPVLLTTYKFIEDRWCSHQSLDDFDLPTSVTPTSSGNGVSQKCEDRCDTARRILQLTALISLLTSLVIGTVWTFSIDGSQCSTQLYDVSWYVVVVSWSIVGTIVGVLLCCLSILACSFACK